MIAETIVMFVLMCVAAIFVLFVSAVLLNALALMAIILRESLEELFRKERRNP